MVHTLLAIKYSCQYLTHSAIGRVQEDQVHQVGLGIVGKTEAFTSMCLQGSRGKGREKSFEYIYIQLFF